MRDSMASSMRTGWPVGTPADASGAEVGGAVRRVAGAARLVAVGTGLEVDGAAVLGTDVEDATAVEPDIDEPVGPGPTAGGDVDGAVAGAAPPSLGAARSPGVDVHAAASSPTHTSRKAVPRPTASMLPHARTEV